MNPASDVRWWSVTEVGHVVVIWNEKVKAKPLLNAKVNLDGGARGCPVVLVSLSHPIEYAVC